jgi:hypothetical protein
MEIQSKSLRSLSIFTLLFGLVAAGSGIGSLMGLSNPTYASLGLSNAVLLDNNLRFYGGIWFALGLSLIWIFRRLETEVSLFRAVFFSIFIGGCGRVLSMLFAGMPPPEFIAYTVLEVIGAPAVLYWHSRVISHSMITH